MRTSEFVANQSTSIPMPLLNPETAPFITKNDQHGVTAFNRKNYPTVFPTQRTISHTNETQCLTDFTKFLLKKDLLFPRLTNFNDRPDNYTIWKSSFKTVMNELGVSTQEELDLIVKWLGPESIKHAINIRAANMRDANLGLTHIGAYRRTIRLPRDDRRMCQPKVKIISKSKKQRL